MQTVRASRFAALAEALSTWAVSREGIHYFRLASVAFQLGVVLFAIELFRIEHSSGLTLLTTLIFGGFLVHALLPLRARQPFFLALSLGAMYTVLGATASGVVVLVGLTLIGICHLPIALWMRVAILLLVAGLLVTFRTGLLQTPWPSLPALVLPVLGAIFMFRLIVYVYDTRHEKKPSTIWERLSYFFLLPNVCFLLFPVVDYQTFRRTYYNEEATQIYQKGVLWIFRGVLHLLLYRLIYHHYVLAPADVASLGDVVQYMLTTYLLYLRISGQFHLIIGILCLFGFNLPETHRLYYLASSFNDYWRRINIYWKDFMMKIFYYPSFMRLRKLGTTTGLVLATLVVFAGTWLLHSYQWFWLQGSFPIAATDALFWGILGGLVAINAVYQSKKGVKRTLGEKEWALLPSLKYSLKVVSMFVTITVLWTLWSSSSVDEFATLMVVAGNGSASEWLLFWVVLAGLVGLGVLIQYVSSRGWSLTFTGHSPSFQRSAIYTAVSAVILVVVGLPHVYERLDPSTSRMIASLQEEQLNRRDTDLMVQGYYEGLLNTGKYTSALATLRADDLEPVGWTHSNAIRDTGDLYGRELVPSSHDSYYRGGALSTNALGLRDREYELEKPVQTYRMGVLGASHVFGAGVNDNEVFEAVVEARLNERHAGDEHTRYEILNFAVPGYSLIQHVLVTNEKLSPFDLDAIMYVAHPNDLTWTTRRYAQAVRDGHEFQDDYLNQIYESAALSRDLSHDEIERRIKPHEEDLLRWGYQEIVRLSQSQGAIPVWVFVPFTHRDSYPEDAEYLSRIAEDAGFVRLNLDGIYDSIDKPTIQLAEWDKHPNAEGHRLIADRLYAALQEHSEALGLHID